jgi:hypothetical protein
LLCVLPGITQTGCEPGGAGAATNEIRIGSDATAVNHDVSFGPVYLAYGIYVGLHMATGQTNPDDLFGRTYSTRPLYVDGGTKIAAVKGPAADGDEHRIATRYDYPVEHILQDVEPSPAVMFETTDYSAFQVAWRMGATADDHMWPGEVIGISYLGGNLRKFDVEYLPAGGAWTKLGSTITLYEEVVYQRAGDTIEPGGTGGTANPFYLAYDELAGGYFEYGATGTVAKIAGNTEGNWDNDGSGTPRWKWPVIRLESPAAAPPAGPATGKLWFPRAQALIYLTTLRRFEGLRISVPAGTATTKPTEGRWRCKFAIGPVQLWGTPPSRGWARVIDAQTDLAEYPDGRRSARVRNVPRRTRSLIWTDFVNSRSAQGTVEPDYIQATTAANTRPAAHRRDSALLVHDLYRHLRGPGNLVTLIPYAPAGTPNTVIHRWQWARGALNGRIVSPLRVTHVLGDAEQTESLRVAEIVVSEEL